MDKIFVGRQAIYDTKMNVFAYEILYRSGNVGMANVFDGNVATSQVLLNTFLEIGFDRLTDSHTGFFNMTREFLVNPSLELPKSNVVLEVLENLEIDAELVKAVENLSRQGYKIALDDFVFEPRWEPLLKLADYIKVEVPAITPDDARKKVAQLRRYKAKLLAEKVETHEEYDLYRKLGFHYFQGYFFCKPKVIEAKSISSGQMSVLRLMAKLQSDQTEISELEAIIQIDPSLSYKLLRYLNSAAFGLRNKITSIRQAVTYLGLRTLRTWVTILAMSGIQGKTSELATLALQRARRAEVLARAERLPDPEQFFMAGLLSILDALLDIPMATVVQELPLSSEMVEGLLKREGPVGRILKAIIAAEQNDWDGVMDNVRHSDADSINQMFLESMFWADEQMRAIASSAA